MPSNKLILIVALLGAIAGAAASLLAACGAPSDGSGAVAALEIDRSTSCALDGMLLKTAETFEQETAQVLDRMLAALVPAITLVLAAVVGVVIIAVLVPLYDLTGAIN